LRLYQGQVNKNGQSKIGVGLSINTRDAKQQPHEERRAEQFCVLTKDLKKAITHLNRLRDLL
jgi:hypothetical protein